MTSIFNRSVFLDSLLAANSTAAGADAPSPTTTEPTGEDVLSVAGNYMVLAFYGVGADNSTGSCGLYGWRNANGLWIPFHLIDLDFTLSAEVGVAGAEVLDTERFADSISVGTVTGPTLGDQVWQGLATEGSDITAHAYIATLGFPKIQLDVFKGTATSVNALHSFM